MSNELLFLLHSVVVMATLLGALAHSYASLLGVLSLQLILANLFVTKQVAIYGIATTTTEVFAVGGMFGVALLQMYYGAERARRSIAILFSFLLFFSVFGWFQTVYAGEWAGADAGALLAVAPRLFCASVVSYFISERVNVALVEWMGGALLLRLCAIVCGQAIDTILFTFIGLWGVVAYPWSVIAASLAIKCAAIAALSPLLACARWWIPPHLFTKDSEL
jgi:uncharacterized integral membrane protein (TIGR00697 family)